MCSKEVQLAISLFEAIDDVNLSNIIILLEKYNANPNVIIPKLQIAPIHFAVGFENVSFAEEVTRIFLRKKADPNLYSKCDSRLTPLHIASIWGRTSIVKMLLDAGGDISMECNEGMTPILYSMQENHFEVIDVIKKFVFEKKIEAKKKQLEEVRASDSTELANCNQHTPKKSRASVLQQLDQKIFTPNRINYNFDSTSPYFVNITHRRKIRTCDKVEDKSSKKEKEEEEKREVQKNLFELTEKNLRLFRKQMSDAIIVERIAIHKRRSYIAEWREKIQQIRENDKLNLSYINYLNSCNDVTLLQEKNDLTTCSDDNNDEDEFKSSSDSFMTANSDLQRKDNQIILVNDSNDLIENDRQSSENNYIENYEEDYIHSDNENGVVLYEKRIVSKNQDVISRMNECAISDSSLSTIVTLPPLDYDTDTLRKELTSYGQNPGPITKHTKKLYLKKLVKIRKYPNRLGVVQEDDQSRITYPFELQRTVTNYDYLESNIGDFLRLESRMVSHFLEKSHLRWREGSSKTSFVYLLLDPRITDNLPSHHDELDKVEVWRRFISSIFYVGKGKSSRPYSHLYDAVKVYKNINCSRSANCESNKLKRIIDIWREGRGVVCLHVFHNIMPSEAYSREAAIIEAIGIHNLTNLKKGDYYGAPTSYTMRQKRQMGISLLYRALHIYLAEGESQMKPDDF